MEKKQSIDNFIHCLARKIASVYSNSYCEIEDYIQVGHLKAIEIKNNKSNKNNLFAYTIISVARAMRRMAIMTTGAVSAPYTLKLKGHKAKVLISLGKTSKQICEELKIDNIEFNDILSIINKHSLHQLFEDLYIDYPEFDVVGDILLCKCLTDNDRVFILAKLDGTIRNIGMDRNQIYREHAKIKNKLEKSCYAKK